MLAQRAIDLIAEAVTMLGNHLRFGRPFEHGLRAFAVLRPNQS